MTSVPAVGHLVPLLGVAHALRDAGHDVRIATHPDVHPLIIGAGLSPVAAGMSGREMTQERLRRWPETATQPGTEWAVRMFASILGPAILTDLTGLCEQWQPDLLIHEEGEYAGPVAAADAGVRWVTHGWGSPLRPAADLSSVEGHVEQLWDTVGLPVPRWGGLYQYGLLNPCPTTLQPDGPGAECTWPIRPEQLSGSQGPPGILKGPPDVYIGFGTVPLFAEDESALTAAVRACVRRGLRTVVTTPDPEQAARLSALDSSLVTAGRFFDLASVLPTCQLVVCHGGAGTVLAALGQGVPLVIVPKGTPSQTRMAAACVAAGVAVASPTPGYLAAATARVLDQNSFCVRAEEVAQDIRAMPPATDVVPVLVALASEDR
ncbi:MAG: DUF1205 domain-containing protein [Mycobacteriales bacterium]